MTETTPRPACLHAYLAYRDAPAALRWLERAFGFETAFEFPDEDGGIMHAEVRFGDVAFSLFSDLAGYDRPTLKDVTVGHGLYIVLDNDAAIDAVHATAVDAGATVVLKPETTEWGSYRFRVLDPEGYEWTFGTLRFGEDTATAGDSW